METSTLLALFSGLGPTRRDLVGAFDAAGDGEIEALDYLSDFAIPINEQCESMTVSPDGEKLWLSCEGRDGVLASAECASFADAQGSSEADSGDSRNQGCAAGAAALWWQLIAFSLARRTLRTL